MCNIIMKYFLVFLFFLFCFAAHAQFPNAMSYQAVVRNSSSQLLVNATVGMKISILQAAVDGNVVYSEQHTVATNENGLLTTAIGLGTVLAGNWQNIPWEAGPFFVKTEMDLTGGTNYTIISTNQLLAVPYALHAKTSEDAARIKTLIYTGF